MRRVCGPLVACVMVLTACSGDDGDPSPTPEPAAATSAEAEPSPTSSPSPAGLPEQLLAPNMRSLAASSLRVVAEEGERRLRFAGSLANLGSGPMVVRPRGRGDDCTHRQFAVQQLLYWDTGGDGTFDRRGDPVGLRRRAGCMLDHPTHDHWHFDAMAAYSLQRPDGRVIAERDKVSFCLRDNARARGAEQTVRRAYFGECSRTADQGISPGWIDIYDADLDGQYLVLPRNTPRTTVCLVVTADPYDQLVETDETDNATTLPLRIRGLRVRTLERGCG